jgi:hypothetical protein
MQGGSSSRKAELSGRCRAAEVKNRQKRQKQCGFRAGFCRFSFTELKFAIIIKLYLCAFWQGRTKESGELSL